MMFHEFTLDGIDYTVHHDGPLLVLSSPDGEMARIRTIPLEPSPGPDAFVPDSESNAVDAEVVEQTAIAP